MSPTLTVEETSGVRMFSDSELEGIHASDNITTLLVVKLHHFYRWDNHSMLNVLTLNTEKCLRLLNSFETKVYGKMKYKNV